MSQYFRIHPDNPQGRLIHQAVEIIRNGGVVAYPTDTSYALGCHLGDKPALERICKIRNLDVSHHFTLLCRDLSAAGQYARFDTPVFRLLRANTPGPYTFLLRATKDVPRRLMHPKRKTIGLRIPDNRISHALLTELNEPMFTTTLIIPEEEFPLTDPLEIRKRLQKQLDLVIDGGFSGIVTTTMIDLLGKAPIILRVGKGDLAPFLNIQHV